MAVRTNISMNLKTWGVKITWVAKDLWVNYAIGGYFGVCGGGRLQQLILWLTRPARQHHFIQTNKTRSMKTIKQWKSLWISLRIFGWRIIIVYHKLNCFFFIISPLERLLNGMHSSTCLKSDILIWFVRFIWNLPALIVKALHGKR